MSTSLPSASTSFSNHLSTCESTVDGKKNSPATTNRVSSANGYLLYGEYACWFASKYGWVDADVLHAVDYKGDKRVIGTVLKDLEKRRAIVASHYIPSKRAKCHHRPIVKYLWRIKND